MISSKGIFRLLSVSASGLACGGNLRSNSQENLDGIGAAIVGKRLEASADLQHGKNVRNRDPFGKPKASRIGVGSPARAGCSIEVNGMVQGKRMGEVVSVDSGSKSGRNGGGFVSEGRRFGE
jgi:hypothetical protein